MKKVSAAPSGRTRVVRLVTRFSRGNPRARNGAIQIKGAPNVTRESRAPPAQNENPSSAPVRALPSASRERKAKKIAPSDKASPQMMASSEMDRFPSSKSTGEPNATPITHALPSQFRATDETGENRQAVRTRPAPARCAQS